MRLCLAIAAVFVATSCFADDGDPLQSVECRRAVQALDVHEAASAPQTGQARDQAAVERDALRQQAARACLGGRADPPPPKRIAQPPIAVPPVTLAPPPIALPPLSRLPRTAPIALPTPAAAPAIVTSCDAGGCWASDGTRLQRSGAAYATPRGLCRVEAGIVRCP